MKTFRKSFAVLFTACCIVFGMACFTYPVKAASIQPTPCSNLTIGLKSKSALAATNDGYMRVFYDGKKVCIEYYDDNFAIQKKQSLEMELSLWGGFYAGSDAYYLVEGQMNTGQSDTAEVIRVIKYDTSWNRLGAASITGNPQLFGGQVREPFDYGCVEMTECNGMLYIVTGHEGYVDPEYGQGHQGFLMIAVDKNSMTGRIAACDLWHSFAQYIGCKDADLYILEQSEGSRYTKLSKYNAENLNHTSIPVLEYGGSRTSAWAIPCHASVDGLALSSDHVLCLGTSIDQTKYDSYSLDMPYNIYLTVTPMSNFSQNATTVKWLTSYSGGGKRFSGTRITKINDNRFLVSWEESGTSGKADANDSLSEHILHYIFVDSQGNTISQEFTKAAPISDCQPVLKGTNIVYYASSINMVNFYSINAESGAFHKKVYQLAGENAVWSLKNGVLTISGTGAMSASSTDGSWDSVKEKVKKIVVSGGITSIPKMAFANFPKLTEAELKSGVKSIGKQAFFNCNSLKKITIPSSVTSIGDDILWTGSYWVSDKSHVVKAVIYAPDHSYAIKYAKKNGISYKIVNDSDTATGTKTAAAISKAVVSGLKKSYAYNGKAQKPKVTVKAGGKKLKEGKDYTVSYSNNKKTGKASIKIKGINNYKGILKKTFQIVPKKAVLRKLASPKSKTIKVTWQKDSQADGYQIQYAQNAKFTKNRHTIAVTKKSTVSKKIPKLLKKKTYYVRIRAYKKIDGKKCYGSWSKSAKVKCK